jgi:hypothetical protein
LEKAVSGPYRDIAIVRKMQLLNNVCF